MSLHWYTFGGCPWLSLAAANTGLPCRENSQAVPLEPVPDLPSRGPSSETALLGLGLSTNVASGSDIRPSHGDRTRRASDHPQSLVQLWIPAEVGCQGPWIRAEYHLEVSRHCR